MKAVFAQVWASRPHVCSNCGYPISEPIAHVFAHIHGKNARPDLKYNPEYIRILCSTWIRRDGQPGCHELEHTNPKKYQDRSSNSITINSSNSGSSTI